MNRLLWIPSGLWSNTEPLLSVVSMPRKVPHDACPEQQEFILPWFQTLEGQPSAVARLGSLGISGWLTNDHLSPRSSCGIFSVFVLIWDGKQWDLMIATPRTFNFTHRPKLQIQPHPKIMELWPQPWELGGSRDTIHRVMLPLGVLANKPVQLHPCSQLKINCAVWVLKWWGFFFP